MLKNQSPSTAPGELFGVPGKVFDMLGFEWKEDILRKNDYVLHQKANI